MRDAGDRDESDRPAAADPGPGVSATRGVLHGVVGPDGLVGRDEDLVAVRARVRPGAVVTITGPGGVGKTSLAVSLVDDVEREPGPFVDGIVVCEMASVVDPEGVAVAVADAAGFVPLEDERPYDTVVAGLFRRSVVLVLDNCEQIVGGTAHFLRRLLDECPSLAVVVTSRERLDIGIEDVFELGPLDVETSARTLFSERAVAASPTFGVEANRYAIASICRSLDGVPLALELAAGCLPRMSATELSERLDERFRMLRDESRPGRNGALHTSVTWSYELLDPDERSLFDRLSVFQGGFDGDGAAAVSGGSADVDARLSSLAIRSMVHVEQLVDPIDGEFDRYDLLETLRLYGDRQLAQRGERASTRNAHLDHMVGVVATTNALALGAGWSTAVERLTRDWENVRAAVNWAIDTLRIDDVDRLLRDLFFTSRWRLDPEPAAWAAKAIERSGATSSRIGAPAHLLMAFAHFLGGDHEAALASNLAGLAAPGTPSDHGWCRNYAAVELLYLGQANEAAEMADRMLADPPPRQVEQAMQLGSHAVFKLYAGQFAPDEALAAIEHADRLAQTCHSVVASGLVAYNRALCEYGRGNVDGFRAAMERALGYARQDGIPNLTGYVLTAQVYAPGRAGLQDALRALEYWADRRDIGNEFVVIEAAGINLVELRRLEPGAVILGHLAEDRRRPASSAARRDAALGELALNRRAESWRERGAGMTRAEILEFTKQAIAETLTTL